MSAAWVANKKRSDPDRLTVRISAPKGVWGVVCAADLDFIDEVEIYLYHFIIISKKKRVDCLFFF